MKNTFIDSAGKLQIVLTGAVTTNQLQWTCSYYDKTLSGNVIVEGEYSGVTNGATAVDICAAPASGHIRGIKNITVYNADTVSQVVILQLVDGGGTRVLIRNSLTTLASWSADDMSFYTDISGKADLASPTFTGTVTLPTVQLGETSIKYDAALSADGKRNGFTVAGTGGETLAFGDLCYFKAADSKWWKVDGILDGTDTGFSKRLGMCVLAGASTTTEILLLGNIRVDAWTLTIGAPVYADDTAGAITVTQPSTTNFAIRIVGYGVTADEMFFNPENSWMVHI